LFAQRGERAGVAKGAVLAARYADQRRSTNIVFAVKVRLPNADKRLKAGMTADAEIELQ